MVSVRLGVVVVLGGVVIIGSQRGRRSTSVVAGGLVGGKVVVSAVGVTDAVVSGIKNRV